MSKISLKLHSSQHEKASMQTLGMVRMLSALKNSELFDVSYHDEYVNTLRDFRATVLYVNDKRIYLDFWEYFAPTYTEKVFRENFDLIIKLQHKKMTEEYFLAESIKNKLFKNATEEQLLSFFRKIVPWSFFSSRILEPYEGKEHELFNENTEIDGFFCGKDWKARRYAKKMIVGSGMQYITSSQELIDQRPLTDSDYIRMMRVSKFGVVTQGRATWVTDTKNRREIDYMMMKKPLLMTYKPNYYVPLENGKHYIYWDYWNKKSLKEIEEQYNIKEIAENGHKWYLENASKNGLVKSFMKIIKDRFGYESV